MKPNSDHSEYKERLIDAAGEIIATEGIENLSAGNLAKRVGLRRTVVHYHFGTMDHLLAALIRRSYAAMKSRILPSFDLATLGQDLWDLYSANMPAGDAVRARALASPVVGEAFREVFEDMQRLLATMLDEAHRVQGIEPEIPTLDMAMVVMMSAQFVGAQRSLGGPEKIASVEAYLKSLFAITSNKEG
jgi:AcrR family transcriptional regulator